MLTLFNTLTKQKEVFSPIYPNEVRMYVCGMTVYDYCHIGHARMLVAFDVIYRWLLALGFQVTYVRNITDIDDKIIQRAMQSDESIDELTTRFIQAMHEDCEALGILKSTIEPCATHHINEMILLIQKLIDRGFAYITENGDVCYDIRQFVSYGQLSGKTTASLKTEARIKIDETKRHPFDFVLWKKAKADEPYWESPWGLGRPGWHIECSAMSSHYLGEYFDIHGGGSDLQFPHHENEIAQSEGAWSSKPNKNWVNYWLHNGFVNVDDKKMSKSLNNFLTIRQALKIVSAEVLRFFIVRSHYRSAINYSDITLEDAKQALTRLYTPLRHIKIASQDDRLINWSAGYAAHFKAAMNDDFNTPEAVAILFKMANALNQEPDPELAAEFKALANILGLLTMSPEAFFQDTQAAGALTKKMIQKMIDQRAAARMTKNWSEADRIRQLLLDNGIELEDHETDKTIWRRRI
jgi:cysteinyl-tRNA synthetase